MPYLGNTPPENFVNVVKQDITGNGGQSYSLNHAVSSAADLEVFVNNVQQEPTTAYTVSGSTITFDEAVSSTDDIYVIFRARSIGTATHPATQPLSATTGTFSGSLSATTSTFSGDLTVDRGTTHASAVVKGGNATTNYSGGSLLLANPGMATNYGGTYLYHHKAGGTGNTNAAFNISQRNASGGYVSNIWNVDYQNNAQSFYVPNGGISGAVALGIDSGGRVTKPYQPHFCAVGPASNNTYNTAPVTNYLTVMKYNTGGHYHTTGANAGKFIAPVTGTYLFYFGAFHNSAVTGRVSLVVNTVLVTNPYISGHSSAMGSGYSASTGVAIQNLAAGDAVQWGVSAGSIYAYGGHTAFGGYLLG